MFLIIMIVVAVSAGIDSMVLLDYLYKQKMDIVIAHVNYQKREDSYLDAQVIKEYIKDKNIIFEQLIVNKDSYTKDNFQAQARKIRYDFFKEVALKYHTNDVYVAHHRDDFLETYIFKKQRGGLYDYFGIKELTNYQGLIIHRPLLNKYREDIVQYASLNNIEYHEDSSNSELIYTRNKNRAYLKTLSIKEKEKMYQEACSLNESILQEKEIIKPYLKDNPDILKRDIFNKWTLNNKRRFLYEKIKKRDITIKQLDEIIRNIEKIGSYEISFKINNNDKIIYVAYDKIYFYDHVIKSFYLIINNVTEYDNFINDYKSNYGISLEKKLIDYPFIIRNYQENDFEDYHYFRKKIKKKKIPFFIRDYLPVIEKDNEILLMIKI
ncbi:MAG: tRNA lysidine(34) synthetase TilS [Bacilli bacterium]|jgi:tRNA(Ile)-lysidine synthase|nr:tRNA lysidine(34) synthetase TilS [Bacilli bacterium]